MRGLRTSFHLFVAHHCQHTPGNPRNCLETTPSWPQFFRCRRYPSINGSLLLNECYGYITDDSSKSRRKNSRKSGQHSKWSQTAYKAIKTSATAGTSIVLLALFGHAYTKYYDRLALEEIEHAFVTGDPVWKLAANRTPQEENIQLNHWVSSTEQERVDRIIRGDERELYHLIMGEKGTGKDSMLIEAMTKVNGKGIMMIEAHADPEIFRLRLGTAMDFEFHEDDMGALFSLRGPRNASAILDIERAFEKLGTAAQIWRARVGRPLILIINSAHLIRDDEQGRNLLELIQQKAEKWAADDRASVVISTDRYWVFDRLKKHSTRMEVTCVHDLSKEDAIQALWKYRQKYWNEDTPYSVLEEVYYWIGGRLKFLNRVAQANDILVECHEICKMERTHLKNKCGLLGKEMDSDVMDQQKVTVSAMLLANKLYHRYLEMDVTYDLELGHLLPHYPLHRAQFMMTRTNFVRKLHDIGIFSVDDRAMLSASSVPMQRAFNDVCNEPGFERLLRKTMDRINKSESPLRTQKLTFKDLWNGGKCDMEMLDRPKQLEQTTTMEKLEGRRRGKEESDEATKARAFRLSRGR